jgi:hypothetical protein
MSASRMGWMPDAEEYLLILKRKFLNFYDWKAKLLVESFWALKMP